MGYGEELTYGEGFYKGDPEGFSLDRFSDMMMEQYEEKENIHFLLSSFLNPLAETSEESYLMQEGTFGLNFAKGPILDMYGKNHGVSRIGLNDEEYRTLIKATIASRKTFGTPESVRSLVKDFLHADIVSLVEIYPAGLYVEAKTSYPLPRGMVDYLKQITPTGIKLYLNVAGNESIFGFEDDGLATGFSEEGYDDIGGSYVEEIA